jgi:hypothetical protein
VESAWVACAAGDPDPAYPGTVAGTVPALPADAAAQTDYVGRDGRVRAISAARNPRTAELSISSGDASTVLPDSGAAVAIADLDQDGAPEILSTLNIGLNVDPSVKGPGIVEDALLVSTWQSGGVLVPRARIAVPAGVRATAACPPNGNGAAWIVLATGAELWIVH